jgi:ankyrin repeat protein
VVDQAVIDELVRCAHGDLARVQEILARHPELVNSPARWGETPIEAAAQMGQREIARHLLDQGAYLDICTAVMLGMVSAVRSALKANPTLAQAQGAHSIPLLYYPVPHSDIEMAELLLSYGADPNAGEGVLTPLHGAALFGKLDMTQWLLDNGAFPGIRDSRGLTPRTIAEQRGYQEIVAELRRYGG